MNDLLKETAERASRYLENLNDRSVFPSPESINRLAQFD